MKLVKKLLIKASGSALNLDKELTRRLLVFFVKYPSPAKGEYLMMVESISCFQLCGVTGLPPIENLILFWSNTDV